MLLKGMGVLRQSIIAKVLLGFAFIYLVVISSLYLFNSDYYPFARSPTSNPVARPGDMADTGFDPSVARSKMMSNPDKVQDFKWEDWVDTIEMRRMQKVAEGPKSDWPKAWEGRNPFTSLQFPPRYARNEEELAINGRLYLAETAPLPKRVIFLGDDYRVVDVERSGTKSKRESDDSEKVTQGETEKNEKEEYREEKKDTDEKKDKEEKKKEEGPKLDRLNDPKDVLFPELASKNLADKVAVDIPWEMFMFNATEEAQKEFDPSWDLETQDYYKMLKYAVANYKKSPKYFYEVPIKGNGWAGTHYDWRFFNMLRHDKDHEAYMHHLIRTWTDFTNRYNVMSWIAHGSMIGWYWNGMAMPWDADNDVQMPIKELDRFARKFNQTLVVQDPREGNGRYIIDVGHWYVERERGNGNNVIDARFIDTRSGIYLDITGLAATGEFIVKQIAHCKNNHQYTLNMMSPARRTLYEGVQVYIPNAYEAVLKSEYKDFAKSSYGYWRYDTDLRLWVKKKDCEGYTDKSKKFGPDKQLTMYGACDKEVYLNEYQNSKLVTKEHHDEMDIYDSYFHATAPDEAEDPTVMKQVNNKLAKLIKDYHAPWRYDPR